MLSTFFLEEKPSVLRVDMTAESSNFKSTFRNRNQVPVCAGLWYED